MGGTQWLPPSTNSLLWLVQILSFNLYLLFCVFIYMALYLFLPVAVWLDHREVRKGGGEPTAFWAESGVVITKGSKIWYSAPEIKVILDIYSASSTCYLWHVR